MDIVNICDPIWPRSSLVFVAMALAYIVPIARLITLPMQYGGRIFMRLNRRAGQWEEVVSPLRDTLLVAYLALGAVWNAYMSALERSPDRVFFIFAALFFITLTFVNRKWKRASYKRLVEFAAKFPEVEPKEFFSHLLCSQGIISHKLPNLPFSSVDMEHLSYSKGGEIRKTSKLSLAKGLWCTVKISRLALLAGTFLKGDGLHAASLGLGTILSTRMIELLKANVSIDGLDAVTGGDFADIFLYTHKGFLDFMLAVLVPAKLAISGKRQRSLPLFLMAENHFRRNFLLYRLLGLGRAGEALGMIFVKRDDRGTRETAAAVADGTVKKIVEDGADIIIFPQGTRALPYASPDKRRIDAGYYTAGSRARMKCDAKHLKRGASYIASDAAIELSASHSKKRVRIIPVGISGTAIVCPKRSMKVLSGVEMKMTVGAPIVVENGDISHIAKAKGDEMISRRDQFAARLHVRIDNALKEALHINPELEHRFFRDIHGVYDSLKLDEVAIAMKQWRGDDSLMHSILDVIYTNDPKIWPSSLGRLVHLLTEFPDRSEILAFKAELADKL